MARFGNIAMTGTSDGSMAGTLPSYGEEGTDYTWWEKALGRNVEGPSPLKQAFSGKSPLANGGDTGFLSMAQGMFDKDPTMFKGLLGQISNLPQQKYTDKLTQVQLATAPFSKTSVGDMAKLMKMSSAGINPMQELQQLREIEDMRRERDQRLANSTRYLDILEASLKKDK